MKNYSQERGGHRGSLSGRHRPAHVRPVPDDSDDATVRRGVNKVESARQFARNRGETQIENIQMGPMRGGWRF